MCGFPLKRQTAQTCRSIDKKEQPMFSGRDTGCFSFVFQMGRAGEIFLCLFSQNFFSLSLKCDIVEKNVG